MYRFSCGEGIKGHTLGNLLMIAMSDILGSEIESIEMYKYYWTPVCRLQKKSDLFCWLGKFPEWIYSPQL